MWSVRSQLCTACACLLASIGVPMIIPAPWALPVGIVLLALAVLFAYLAWRTRMALAIPPEVVVLLERIRRDRQVVSSAPDNPRTRVLTVVPVPNPRVTPERVAEYRETDRQLRAHGWSVRGWPLSPQIALRCGAQYPYIQDEQPGAGPEMQIHLGRVCVHNGLVDAIESVEVSLIEVSVVASGSILQLTGLPANLILMNDRPPYRAFFRLGGEADQYVDLLTVHLRPGDIFVQHIVPGVDIKLRSSDGPFLFRLRVTGEGLSRIERVFEVGVAARRLYIRDR